MQGVRVRATASVAAVAVLGVAAIFAASASAAVIPVMNTNDTGMNSLRAAMTTANSTIADDTIDITTTGTIDLTSAALPAIAPTSTGGKLTIQGPGAASLTVQRAFAAAGPVFGTDGNGTGANATISGLTIKNGSASGIVNFAVLKLDRVEVTGNSASGAGGGVFNGSGVFPVSLTVDRSSIIRNSSGSNNAGGILNNSLATLTVTRSTISDNDGGGINSFGSASSITGSTIAGNTVAATSPTDGANVYSEKGPLTIRDTLIADPLSSNATVPANCRQFGAGTPLVSQGFNLADDASCAFSTPSDRPVADPGLTGLAGAPPRVLPVAPGSPAADKIPGGSCATATDERGVTRPQGGACEIGAYEIDVTPTLTPAPITAPIKFCKVPNLVGQKAAAAQAQLTAAGCGAAKIVRKPVKKKKQRGKILSTNPAAGGTAAPGTAVKVTVGVKKK